jgi:quercetin dioxygenase-like cupin family protein
VKKILILVASFAALCAIAEAQKAKAAKEASTHVLAVPVDLKWGDPPPVFEKGMSFSVVSGDPGKAGPFVVRAKFPAGYKIQPHWHPTDENVTVLVGTMAVGMGEKFDTQAMKEMPTGSYAMMPAKMRHYAMAKTNAIIQVHGQGPFTLTYVNPADDPSKREPAPAK